MSRFKAYVVGLFAAAAIVGVLPAATMAAHHQDAVHRWSWIGPDAAAWGVVGSTGTGDFVVTTPGGISYTVSTTAKTTFKPVSATDGATFQTGDAVFVRGYFLNGVVARVVWFDNVPFGLPGQRNITHGTGVSNSSTQIVITDKAGNTHTYVVTSNTKFWVNGRATAEGSVPNISGDRVEVVSQDFTNGSDIALKAFIVLPRPA